MLKFVQTNQKKNQQTGQKQYVLQYRLGDIKSYLHDI